MKSETDPLGKLTSYGYDKASNLTSITDRVGRIREFGYDVADQNTSETWKAPGGHWSSYSDTSEERTLQPAK